MTISRSGLTHVARKFVPVVTPSDTVNVAPGALGIYIGGAGNVSVMDLDNNVSTFIAPPVGSILPISPKRVMAALTTATLLILVY